VSVLRKLRAVFHRDRQSLDVQEELSLHLDEIARDLEDQGVPPAEACRQARLRLGGAVALEEASRDAWTLGWIETWLRDLRLAARALRRQPIFSLAAIATFALGIGAATAIFSVAYGVAFRPLPFPAADRLVRIYEANTATNEPTLDVSQGTFQGWREGASSLTYAALYSKGSTQYLAGATPQPITTMSVSPRFFDVLGVAPAIGRTFKPDDQYTRFTAREIVLSDAAWERFFGRDPAIVGKFVSIVDNSKPIEIVGVMPRDFAFENVDGFQPKPIELPIAKLLRSWHYDRAIARLAPGATLTRLRGELDAVSARLAQEFPATNAGWKATVVPLRDAVIGQFARASWLLIAAVAVVLLVACANVAGLLVARAMGRARETTIRVALGAGFWRIAQLWFSEALVLATAGAAVGVGFAWLLVRTLRAVAPTGLPRVDDITIDLPVLAMTALATIASAIVFALAPLAGLRRRARQGGVRADTDRTGDTPARRRLSTALVAIQCAAALGLVVLAVAFTRSFLNLSAIDLGWRPERILSLDVSPRLVSPDGRPWFLYHLWSDALIARLEATPGIERASVVTDVPFGSFQYVAEVAAGREQRADEARWPIQLHSVMPHFADVLGVQIVRGRRFSETDAFSEAEITSPARPAGVAIVSESLAAKIWPDQDAIGKPLHLPGQDQSPFREVVGVMRDAQFREVGGDPSFDVYVPWKQFTTGRPRLIVKTAADPAAMAATVRAAVLAENPATIIDRVIPVDTLYRRATSQPRVTSQLVAALGALALALAGVGVYGALSTLVHARAREIAVRMALGATPAHTWWHTLKTGLTPVVAGTIAGAAVAMLLVAAVRSLLFGVSAVDAWSLAIAAAATFAVALIACAEPAWRAARTQPLKVLRGD